MHTLPSRGNAHLCPVGEDLAVAAVCDQLLRKLRDSVVQVVHDHQDDGDCLTGLSRVQLQRVRPARDGRGRSLGTPRVQLQRVHPARDGRGRSLGDTPGTAAAGTPCTRRERTVTGGHPGYSCSGYTLHETGEDGHWGTPRVQLQRVRPARDGRGRSLGDTPGTAAAGTPCTRRERTVTGGHPGYSCSGYALHETGEDGHWGTPRVQLQRVRPARDGRGRSPSEHNARMLIRVQTGTAIRMRGSYAPGDCCNTLLPARVKLAVDMRRRELGHPLRLSSWCRNACIALRRHSLANSQQLGRLESGDGRWMAVILH